ncbi:MAG: VWA domain-containing protein [Erysipelotrichaceae bacterium]|nr:VWA domain-containing protein [Erysipelotrichaceae bacterium]
MNELSSVEISEQIYRLENMKVGVMTNPRTPLCIILDLSGSMELYKDQIKSIVRQTVNHLKAVGKRYFTLIIIGIYRDRSRVLYFGELRDFDAEAFIGTLPLMCRGHSPLVSAFRKADTYLGEVMKACEVSKQICTIPFFFIVTDAKCTENTERYTGILKTLSEDMAYNRKIIVECVTSDNEDGVDFGGYKILMDQEDSEKTIINCMKALQLASSTDVDATNGPFDQVSRPPKNNRVAYGEYLSHILATNVLFYFNNLTGRDA